MDELKSKVLGLLNANGGEMSWDAVKAELDYREQSMLPRAIASLKSDGLAQRQNRRIDGELTLVVFSLGQGVIDNG